MKERIKKICWWLEDKLKSLCGEITPDKRITVILIMLLLFTIGNLYFTFSTIYNWGRDKERQEQMEIEHTGQPELRMKSGSRDFIDPAIGKRLFDLYRQKTETDSTDSLQIQKQKYNGNERKTENQPRAEAKA